MCNFLWYSKGLLTFYFIGVWHHVCLFVVYPGHYNISTWFNTLSLSIIIIIIIIIIINIIIIIIIYFFESFSHKQWFLPGIWVSLLDFS